jgi:hypothetical protein
MERNVMEGDLRMQMRIMINGRIQCDSAASPIVRKCRIKGIIITNARTDEETWFGWWGVHNMCDPFSGSAPIPGWGRTEEYNLPPRESGRLAYHGPVLRDVL